MAMVNDRIVELEIRPDEHIVRRSDTLIPDPVAALRDALTTVLGRA